MNITLFRIQFLEFSLLLFKYYMKLINNIVNLLFQILFKMIYLFQVKTLGQFNAFSRIIVISIDCNKTIF